MARELALPLRPVYSKPANLQVWPAGASIFMITPWGKPSLPALQRVCQKVLGSPSKAAVTGPLGGVSPLSSWESTQMGFTLPVATRCGSGTVPPEMVTLMVTTRSPWVKVMSCSPLVMEPSISRSCTRVPSSPARMLPTKASPILMAISWPGWKPEASMWMRSPTVSVVFSIVTLGVTEASQAAGSCGAAASSAT